MNGIKEYITLIVTVAAILKITNIILDSTKFAKTYKTVSGLIMAFTVITPLISLSFGNSFLKDNTSYFDFNQYDEYSVNKLFESNLENMINEDLNEQFGSKYSATVECDETFRLKIYLSGEKIRENRVDEYIIQKYCTSSDEVVVNQYE